MAKPKSQSSDELKKLKEELKKVKVELKKQKKLASIGTMASSIAHEIKNPLVAVKTFFDLFPTKHDDVEFRDSFSLIVKREVERINELVTQLLDFARPKKPQFEDVDLQRIIRDTLDLLAIHIKDSNVNVAYKDGASLPKVRADREQISRVFMNIILNGVQAMHQGGALEISCSPNKNKLETSIKDNGTGISDQDLEQIFEPFFSTKHKGSGLGLCICQQIIQDHEGEILVHSSPKGTEFKITIPICN